MLCHLATRSDRAAGAGAEASQQPCQRRPTRLCRQRQIGVHQPPKRQSLQPAGQRRAALLGRELQHGRGEVQVAHGRG